MPYIPRISFYIDKLAPDCSLIIADGPGNIVLLQIPTLGHIYFKGEMYTGLTSDRLRILIDYYRDDPNHRALLSFIQDNPALGHVQT